MLRTYYIKYLIIIGITTLFISSYVIADEMTDKISPEPGNDNGVRSISSSLKPDSHTIHTLEWLREIGKKQVGEASYKMAIYSMQQKDWNKAKKLIVEAVAMEPINLQYLKYAIHIAYHQHDYKMAEIYLLNVLNIRGKSLENKPMEKANLLDDLAIIYKAQERLYEARKVIRKSLSISKENRENQSPKFVERLFRLADLNMRLGDYGEAVLEMEQAIQILEKNPNKSSEQEIAKAYHNIGEIYRFQKYYSNAQTAYLKALELWEENTKQGKSGKKLTKKGLALVQTKQKNIN